MVEAGAYVKINDVRSRPELNVRTWVVEGAGRDDRLVVRSLDTEALRISVPRDSVAMLAIVPLNAPRAEPKFELAMLERFAEPHNEDRLGQWLRLPGYGGNAIMLQRATPPGRDLVMYPQFRGLELHFRSVWAGETFILIECDILKPCPACQVWPYCAMCQKFQLPVAAHRCSRAHTSNRRHLEAMDHDAMRGWCMQSL